MEAINPWDLMTSHDRQALERTAAHVGQQLSIAADPRGWVIRVFSCYAGNDWEISILVARDGTVEITNHVPGTGVFEWDLPTQ